MKTEVLWALAIIVPLLLLFLRPRATASSQQAQQLVADGAALVDVRSPAEFDQGHLPGAVNIPVQELEQGMARLSKEKPIVVYCRSGARSSRARQHLEGSGFHVYDLGGMGNWEKKAP